MLFRADLSHYGDARHLAVFVPLVHAMRAMGLARSLRRAGHTLIMDGPTSMSGLTSDVKISEVQARAAWGENIRCYENSAIFDDPPDVLIVGAEGLEPEAFPLWHRLSELKPVVLCALSGCYQSRFSWTAYRGHICADGPSRALARFHDVPAIRYYELFEPNDYPLLPWDPDAPITLPTFVNHFEMRFPLSASFQRECASALREAFGDRVRAEVVDGRPNEDVRATLAGSAATLAIKDQEGYGWSMLEALSSGRPIIYQRGLLRGMEFHKWTEDGISAFGFTTPRDLVDLVGQIMSDPSAYRQKQIRTAEILRERYDGAATGDDLNAFLGDLVRLERCRWRPGRLPPTERRQELPYEPSLDPAQEQDWERVTGSVAVD